jgi:arsenate reductase (thioredoxin)
VRCAAASTRWRGAVDLAFMEKRIGVVFVSRRSSLRSMLAQACLSHLGSGRFAAQACGQPGQISDAIHPAAVAALGSAGMAVPQARPQSWNELTRSTSTRASFVITLDAAVQALEPRWPGQPDTALWDFPDVAASGEPVQMEQAATRLLYALRRRLELLTNLPLFGADAAAVRSDIRDLAHMP